MKIFDFTQFEKIYFVGDIHGEFEYIFSLICSKLRTSRISKRDGEYANSVFVFLGDIGLGFSNKSYYDNILTKYNKLLSERNTHALFIRGNHDDPSYFSEEKINLSNIKTIPDYSIIKFKNHNALCIGGGLSIDRKYRKSRETILNLYTKNAEDYKKLYWENESVVYSQEELEKVYNSGIAIDLLLTHIPSKNKENLGNQNILDSWLECDETLQDDLDKENNTMSAIFESVIKNEKIKVCAWGHMHKNAIFSEDGIIFSQLLTNDIINLDDIIDEFSEEKKEDKSKLKKHFDFTMNYFDMKIIDPFDNNGEIIMESEN